MADVRMATNRVRFEAMAECDCGRPHVGVAASAWRSTVEDCLRAAGLEPVVHVMRGPDATGYSFHVLADDVDVASATALWRRRAGL